MAHRQTSVHRQGCLALDVIPVDRNGANQGMTDYALQSDRRRTSVTSTHFLPPTIAQPPSSRSPISKPYKYFRLGAYLSRYMTPTPEHSARGVLPLTARCRAKPRSDPCRLALCPHAADSPTNHQTSAQPRAQLACDQNP